MKLSLASWVFIVDNKVWRLLFLLMEGGGGSCSAENVTFIAHNASTRAKKFNPQKCLMAHLKCLAATDEINSWVQMSQNGIFTAEVDLGLNRRSRSQELPVLQNVMMRSWKGLKKGGSFYNQGRRIFTVLSLSFCKLLAVSFIFVFMVPKYFCFLCFLVHKMRSPSQLTWRSMLASLCEW